MRFLSRSLITALAAGCLALTAGTSAAATPRSAPDPVPGACDVDWTGLAGITGTGTLQEAIVACVEAYTERDLESWLQTPPKPPAEQQEQPAEQSAKDQEKEQGKQEDWTGADAGDWASDLSCDLAELFDEPTACRPSDSVTRPSDSMTRPSDSVTRR
ncbi:hypothetical protein C6Y14_19850 [Streptomyces dioscori]|uniref:Secreted protein n=1 Tax=Streptomyces dioscori TaxID=2109333 RepID=A0A2P8Q5L0_9ACTN|nr:hypothetical protein [Streptomyces dioscori]PSM41544.1 hypothetical protein C6Y14_19850 [Streptomyces dioscori]